MRVIGILCLVVCAGCLGSPIHAKSKKRLLTAAERALPHEWVEIPAGKSAVLRGIYVRNEGPPVLLMYGSGMHIAKSEALILMLFDAGYSVLCCDYRGTGHSSGPYMLTSRFLDDDARAMWEWLVSEKGEPAGVLGVSVGAVAATALLAHPSRPAAVVLDRPVNPTTVIPRFIGQHTRFGGFIAPLIVHPACDVDLPRAVSRAEADTLVVLPAFDVLHLPKDVENLRASMAAPVTVATVPGGHLSSHLVQPTLWRSTILDYLDARLRPGQPALGGRTVDADLALVTSATLEDRTLTVELDRDSLPKEATLLVLCHKLNGLVRVREPRRRMRFTLTRKEARKLGPLFTVRMVAETFKAGVGTRWILGGPEPVRPE